MFAQGAWVPHMVNETNELAAIGSCMRQDKYSAGGSRLGIGSFDLSNTFNTLPWEPIYSSQNRVLTRYACWLTTEGCSCKYRYGGKNRPPVPMPEWLISLTTKVAKAIGVHSDFLNSLNINMYSDPSHDCYWHADNEPLFKDLSKDRDTFIVSLSLGGSRKFSVRRKYATDEVPVPVHDGDLYVMCGAFQDLFEHTIKRGVLNLEPTAASSSSCNPTSSLRYNLTWRWHRTHARDCNRVQAI